MNTRDLATMNLKNGSVKLYALSGKIATGKDILAEGVGEILAKDLNNESIQLSFAAGVREEISMFIDLLRKRDLFIAAKMDITEEEANQIKVLLLSDVEFYNDNYGPSIRTKQMRTVLQLWGTEIRRNKYEDYWVDKLKEKAYIELSNGNNVYITDARFPNEVEAILNMGGQVIRLITSEKRRIERIIERDSIVPTEESLNHVSETALDNYSNFTHIYDSESNDTEKNIIAIYNLLKESN